MDLLKKGTLFAFALSAVSGVAWAGGGAHEGGVQADIGEEVSFQEADLDDSGLVDAEEAAKLGLDVVEYDIDFDGTISPTEWERAPEQATEAQAAGEGEVEAGATGESEAAAADAEAGAMMSAADEAGVSFEEADLDDSGFVDAEEASELGLDVVQYDTDFDGTITPTEWERAPSQATDPGEESEQKY